MMRKKGQKVSKSIIHNSTTHFSWTLDIRSCLGTAQASKVRLQGNQVKFNRKVLTHQFFSFQVCGIAQVHFDFYHYSM